VGDRIATLVRSQVLSSAKRRVWSSPQLLLTRVSDFDK
jgi:hypothetical protein